jgi:hypothetical protein
MRKRPGPTGPRRVLTDDRNWRGASSTSPPRVPTLVWGRDELGTCDMWTQTLLWPGCSATSGLDTQPDRAAGRRTCSRIHAGLIIVRRQ